MLNAPNSPSSSIPLSYTIWLITMQCFNGNLHQRYKVRLLCSVSNLSKHLLKEEVRQQVLPMQGLWDAIGSVPAQIEQDAGVTQYSTDTRDHRALSLIA